MENTKNVSRLDEVTYTVYAIKDSLILASESIANIKQPDPKQTAYEYERLTGVLDSVLNDCINRLSDIGSTTADIGMNLYNPNEVA